MGYAWCVRTDARSQNHPAWQSQWRGRSKHRQSHKAEHDEEREDGEDETFLFGQREGHGQSPVRARPARMSRISGSGARSLHGRLLDRRTKYWLPCRLKPYCRAICKSAGME